MAENVSWEPTELRPTVKSPAYILRPKFSNSISQAPSPIMIQTESPEKPCVHVDLGVSVDEAAQTFEVNENNGKHLRL